MSRTRHRRGRNRWPGRGFIRAICQCVTARCVDIGHGTSNISHLLELRQVRTSTAMPCRIARLNYTIFHGLVSPLSNCHLGRASTGYSQAVTCALPPSCSSSCLFLLLQRFPLFGGFARPLATEVTRKDSQV